MYTIISNGNNRNKLDTTINSRFNLNSLKCLVQSSHAAKNILVAAWPHSATLQNDICHIYGGKHAFMGKKEKNKVLLHATSWRFWTHFLTVCLKWRQNMSKSLLPVLFFHWSTRGRGHRRKKWLLQWLSSLLLALKHVQKRDENPFHEHRTEDAPRCSHELDLFHNHKQKGGSVAVARSLRLNPH